MDHYGRPEHVDAGDLGRVGVGADGEHVLAESGLVPDEPHQRHKNHGVQHVPRNGDLRAGAGGELDHGCGDHALILLRQAGNGLAVVAVEHEEDQDQAVSNELGGQRHDEGVQAELGYEEAVHHTDQRADGDDNENRQQNPTRGNGREVGEKLPGDGAILQQRARDGCGQTDHTSAGQVGTGQDDTAGDAQRHGQ